MQEVRQVLVPSLEEIVLIKMPKLVKCSSTSVETLSSSLRVLQIEKCHALKEFDLFEKYDESEIEQRSWLPGIRELNLRDCPHLEVLNPLPPSTTVCELLIREVSTLPSLKGPSSDQLHIGLFREQVDDCEIFDEYSDELVILDDKILAFHNLGNLTLLTIDGCRNLMSISFEGFCQLVSLKHFEIRACEKLFSSEVIIDATHEDVTGVNCKALPSLKFLGIRACGIVGKWLSLMLHHAPDLRISLLFDCPHITLLSIEEEENSPPNIITAREGSSSGNQDVELTGLVRDELLNIPLDLLSSLKSINFYKCPHLTFEGSKKGFSAFTSLEDLTIYGCSDLLSSLVHKDGDDDRGTGRWLLPTSLGSLRISGYSQETLQPCFPSDLTSLETLKVWNIPGLESLQLQSCTALTELKIDDCESLTTVEGLQSLSSLRRLKVYGFSACLESFSRPGYGLCSSLETLEIDDPAILATSFCNQLTSLQRLKLHSLMELTALTYEEETTLVLLTSLQELEFSSCSHLVHLPTGLHLLHSLKRLKILTCLAISTLPDTGLPVSMEELEINKCSKELADQCKGKASSKLRVKIDGDWLVL
ncbi:hypothetical protein ACQ4PT_066052 [Festuca glaucescens]